MVATSTSWRADKFFGVTTSGGAIVSSLGACATDSEMAQAGDASALAWKRPGLVLKQFKWPSRRRLKV